MKFLIINRPTGHDHGLDGSADSVHSYANAVEAGLKNGSIEAAYALIAGGSAYVINAKNTEELATKVRYNPLFASQTTEVIPVADAVDFLRGAAKHA